MEEQPEFNVNEILKHIDDKKAKAISDKFYRNWTLPNNWRKVFCPVCGNILRNYTELQLGFHFNSNKLKCFRKISKGIEYDT